MRWLSIVPLSCSLWITGVAAAQRGGDATLLFEQVGDDVVTSAAYADYHLHADVQVVRASDAARVQLAPGVSIAVGDDAVGRHALDVYYEHRRDRAPRLRAWWDGVLLRDEIVPLSAGNPTAALPGLRHSRDAGESFDWGKASFAVAARFRGRDGGTLAAKAPPSGDWQPNAKALFLRGGRLVYDIGWVGALQSRRTWNDGEWHRVVLTHDDGAALLFVDGELDGERAAFTAPDAAGHVFKIGAASPNFGGAWRGELAEVDVFDRQLDPAQARAWSAGVGIAVEPALRWRPGLDEPGSPTIAAPIGLHTGGGAVRFADVWLRPLGPIDHAGLIRGQDDAALARGARLYAGLCQSCHGEPAAPGAAPAFWRAGCRNGSDPLALFATLRDGFGEKAASPWLPPELAYDVVHYVRTRLLGAGPVDAAYLAALPPGLGGEPPALPLPPQPATERARRMDYGRALHWTYQVADDNIAYKGIGVRVDGGRGGVATGRAWLLYDHDTMRVAAAWQGTGFIDWKGVAFDDSHQTHASIVGDVLFVNPVGPGCGRPTDGSFDDPRLRGRDGKPYGPLPRDWVQYRGRYAHGDDVVLAYSVGDAEVLEMPGCVERGALTAFTRTLQIGRSTHDLLLRVAPASIGAALSEAPASARLEVRDGFWTLAVPAAATPWRAKLWLGAGDRRALAALALAEPPANDLAACTQGGPAHWAATLTTTIETDEGDGPFVVDTFTVPADDVNPWSSRMRFGGFDFYDDGRRAALSTWNGDVWEVSGLDGSELRWRRIAAGLFQPLGLRIVEGTVFVACRDQIAALEDLDGDGEIDFYRCFNNDHQVTEHFHEFAMGLQTDAEGNFYYAKSARHALPALVPHHGTLLRVSKDGARTDIVANGFRAANGVCVNDDGTFFVTDQEGHWTPKNRINLVRTGGFYGNMMGYHDATSSDDAAMQQPLCWITNDFDRSPAELVQVRGGGWGALDGALLQVSYGSGRIFQVLRDTVGDAVQGGMIALPLPPLPTGVMRGRFHPRDHQLYVCGLVGWSSNRTAPGGFYRVRCTGAPLRLPLALRAGARGVELTFDVPLDPETAADPESFAIRVWSLRRSSSYGSDHLDERELPVRSVQLSTDHRTVTLAIPDLAPTRGLEIRYSIDASDGAALRGVIHGTIHALR